MEKIYLSKRNLLTLLSKLERFDDGDATKCAIVKYANHLDPYSNTMDEVMVVAIPDEKFYTNRTPGQVHEKDDPSPDLPREPSVWN